MKGIYPAENLYPLDVIQTRGALLGFGDTARRFRSTLFRKQRKEAIESATSKHSRQLAQSTGSVLFGSNPSGNWVLSVLQDMQSQGGIVLHVFCEDGTMQSHTLTRLPEELIANVELTLLPRLEDEPDESDEMVRIVLNRPQQNGYILDERQSYPVPAMITRSKKTIPVVEGNVQLRIEEGVSLECMKLPIEAE